jgi:hypothetical protein
MRKKVAVAAGAVVAIMLALFVYTNFLDRSTPVGQPPLTELNQQMFETFKSDFNRARGQVRVIALLSPT